MRLLVGLLVLYAVEAALRAPKYDPPVLTKKELPPPPFPVERVALRDLVPGRLSLVETPINIHGMVGTTVVLLCRALLPPPVSRILWYEFASSGTGQVISDNYNILPSHPNNQRYRIVPNADPTWFYLEISNVNLNDGGSYACADIQSGPPEVYSGQADLVVLTDHPECSTLVPESGIVLEGQNFTKECTIRYRGGLAPVFHWSGPEPYLRADITTPTEVVTGIAFTIDRGMDTRAYRTECNFTTPTTTPPGVATNPPIYYNLYQYGQFFVYWSPKNMFAVPMKPEYFVGDQITCHADAFPAPFYAWQNLENLDIVNEQVFTVTPNMVGRNQTMRCQAQNLIQGFLYSSNHFIPVYVPAPTTPTPTTTTPTTTTPLPEGSCSNLTGWWLSTEPYAEIYFQVLGDQSGQVVGFMRNGTDQHWIEVFGRVRLSDYNYLGLTAIWPYDIGVTGMAGECHRCFGEEVLMTAGIWRSSADSAICGHGGTPTPHTTYKFYRISIGMPGKAPYHDPDFKVHQASDYVSGKLGLSHLLKQ